MILGTVFGGWWGWEYGPWGALLGGVGRRVVRRPAARPRHDDVRRQPHRRRLRHQHPRPRHRPIHVDDAVRRRAGRFAHQLARCHGRHRRVHDAVPVRRDVLRPRDARTPSGASTSGTGSPCPTSPACSRVSRRGSPLRRARRRRTVRRHACSCCGTRGSDCGCARPASTPAQPTRSASACICTATSVRRSPVPSPGSAGRCW